MQAAALVDREARIRKVRCSSLADQQKVQLLEGRAGRLESHQQQGLQQPMGTLVRVAESTNNSEKHLLETTLRDQCGWAPL